MTPSSTTPAPAPADASAQAIGRLIMQYSHAVDSGDFRAVGALFAHGRLDNSVRQLAGSAAVELLLHTTLRRYPDGTPRTTHVTTNLLVDVEEAAGTATATSYVTILQADPDSGFALQPIFVGRYHDQFHRLHGAWHFLERRLAPLLVGDLSRNATSASGFAPADAAAE